MARRHVKAQKKLSEAVASTVPPVVGQFLLAYWDRSDIGSGVRPVLVTRVGPKWITMFYLPGLITFQIKHNEWAVLEPRSYVPSLEYWKAYAESGISANDFHENKYNRTGALSALSIVKGALNDRRRSDKPLHSARIRRVSRDEQREQGGNVPVPSSGHSGRGSVPVLSKPSKKRRVQRRRKA